METIYNKDDKTTYCGQTLVEIHSKDGKVSKLFHGNGRLLNYPYLLVGQFEKGNFKSGQVYMQPNCGNGENFSFEKQQKGEQQISLLLNFETDPVTLGYELVNENYQKQH